MLRNSDDIGSRNIFQKHLFSVLLLFMSKIYKFYKNNFESPFSHDCDLPNNQTYFKFNNLNRKIYIE